MYINISFYLFIRRTVGPKACQIQSLELRVLDLRTSDHRFFVSSIRGLSETEFSLGEAPTRNIGCLRTAWGRLARASAPPRKRRFGVSGRTKIIHFYIKITPNIPDSRAG